MIKIFQNLWNTKITKPELSIQFGRFSDLYKTKDKYVKWDNAIAAYKKNEYFKSFKYFLEYIKEDSSENTIIVEETESKIVFEILQGSKLIQGTINKDGIFAESKLASGKISIGAMRSILDDNYGLKYTRYALDGNDLLTMVFQSDLSDSSPYKMYNGLKELALRADHQDDILVNHFMELKPIKIKYISEISTQQKTGKYNYFIQELNLLRTRIETPKLSVKEYPGSLSYFILDFIYRVDYLIKPEGRVLELIEEIDSIYFNNSLLSPQQKNENMIKKIEEMNSINQEDFFDELYDTKHTFGITQVGNVNQLLDFMKSEMMQFDWYVNNGHQDVAQSICNFIIGHTFYNYAMPEPIQRMMHLYYHAIESRYFEKLGYESMYTKTGEIDRKKINMEIVKIRKELEGKYTFSETSSTSYSVINKLEFSVSWLQLLSKMKMEKFSG